MSARQEEVLRNPPAGSRIEAARDYGIDLTLLIENLRLSPGERVRKNDAVLNDLLRLEKAMTRARSKR